jgi:hypothetical protein
VSLDAPLRGAENRRMNRRPNSLQGSRPSDADADADDEAFPPTRFFSDAIARNPAPLKRGKRNFTLLAVMAGFGLTLVALVGLLALLTA